MKNRIQQGLNISNNSGFLNLGTIGNNAAVGQNAVVRNYTLPIMAEDTAQKLLVPKADIFVSYRRDDSQWFAGRINDRLIDIFGTGSVFLDTVSIEPGEDFAEVIGSKVASCRVVLAVIGPRWLDLLCERCARGHDFVHVEIREALRRGVRVVPLLIDGALPPPDFKLPADIKSLSQRNALTVNATTFDSDFQRLVDFLKSFLT